MSLSDLDLYYIKSVSSLHSYEHIINREPSLIQVNLEEAIKNKTGVVKDFTQLIASVCNRPIEELRVAHAMEESKTTSSSDNELELDLFNEDLMCVVCNGMDVAARNRLLECSDCHSLYHQECHRPPVTGSDADGTWTCQRCKDASKRLKKSTPGSSPLHASSSPTSNKPAAKNSPPPSRAASTSSYKVAATKSLGSVLISKSLSSAKIIGKAPAPTPSNSSGKSSSVTPNINIISADKRLQIMKKKAAKLHEKRKQLPR